MMMMSKVVALMVMVMELASQGRVTRRAFTRGWVTCVCVCVCVCVSE
jgi:hypothetical protein